MRRGLLCAARAGRARLFDEHEQLPLASAETDPRRPPRPRSRSPIASWYQAIDWSRSARQVHGPASSSRRAADSCRELTQDEPRHYRDVLDRPSRWRSPRRCSTRVGTPARSRAGCRGGDGGHARGRRTAYAPVAAFTWRIEPEAVLFLIGAGLPSSRTSCCSRAYGRAELSVVYPVSRGVAPGARPAGRSHCARRGDVGTPGRRRLPGRRRRPPRASLSRRADWTGVLFDFLHRGGDRLCTRSSTTAKSSAAPFVYLELSMLLPAVVYTAFLGARKGVSAIAAEARPAVVLAGLMTFGAYGLVLAALQRAGGARRSSPGNEHVIATGPRRLFSASAWPACACSAPRSS